MKVTIFGSTGATGIEIVRQALEREHSVVAFARNPEKIDIKHDNLRLHQGDILDYSSVENALKGQEGVVSAIGAGAKRTTLRTDGTRNIVKAMENTGVRRLVNQSTVGIGESRNNLPFLSKYIFLPLLLQNAITDHEGQEQCIMQSGLDWVIVRPAGLTKGPRTGTYQHGDLSTVKGLKFRISRADVADFMLNQLQSDTYLHKTPSISY